MTNNTKEFYDLMKNFEGTVGKSMNHTKEDKGTWKQGYYYTNGETNKLFVGFLNGYQLAKSLARAGALPLDA